MGLTLIELKLKGHFCMLARPSLVRLVRSLCAVRWQETSKESRKADLFNEWILELFLVDVEVTIRSFVRPAKVIADKSSIDHQTK